MLLRRSFSLFVVAMAWVALPVAAQDAEGVITATDALARQQAGKLTLIDIRQPEEWRQTGMAKGAKGISMRHPQGPNGFLQELTAAVGGDRNAPIGLICRTGNRTTAMHKALREVGFTQVFNIKEGMAGSAAGPGWLARGLPVQPVQP